MQKKKSNFIYDFLLAGVSASIGKTATAPLERAKLLLQNQNTIDVIEKKYKGTFDCIYRLAKEEGFFSLWRGNTSNVIRYFPSQALNFAFKDTFKNMFPVYDPTKKFWKFLITNCISGGLAGALSMAICQPIDMARTRMATDNKDSNGKRKFKGSIDCLRKIYKVEGLKGVFRGTLISCVGIFPYRAMYFGVYDTLKTKFLHKDTNFFVKWLMAQSVTIAAGLCFYPLDTIRRRIMIESGKPAELKRYKNSFHCFYRIFKEEGYFGLYKGYGTNALRTLGSSVVLVLYDEFQKVCGLEARGKGK